MFDDFRMWRLVRYLSRKGIIYEAEARPINKAFNFNTNIAHNLPLDSFLEERANTHWFGIWKFLPKIYIEIQIQKDNRLMQIANALNYVEITEITIPLTNKKTIIIHYLPDGYKFSSPSAFIVFFAEKYKIIWFLVIGLIGLTPLFRPIILKIIKML